MDNHNGDKYRIRREAWFDGLTDQDKRCDLKQNEKSTLMHNTSVYYIFFFTFV